MVYSRIKDIVTDLGISNTIGMDTNLYTDLGMDSTELAEVATFLVKEFGVSIRGKDLKGYTVSQIIDHIENNKA